MVKIAVATSDWYNVDQHFGRAEHFLILTADEDTGEILQESERVETPFCQEQSHNEGLLFQTLNSLKDCQYILVSKIGPRARNEVEQFGIQVYEIPGDIVRSVEKLLQYIRLQKFMSEVFPQEG